MSVFCDKSGIFGEPAGTRTQDHSIKSRMLYQLSYRFIRTLATPQPAGTSTSSPPKNAPTGRSDDKIETRMVAMP
ncbi:hypothetical protein AA103587_0620 [Gluconobacter kanchanaburiensis NBRC 103587]|nr:hypothetical protein AA103587_0620 [Gluconobacter kanchanaburiensis NBRC 103587]